MNEGTVNFELTYCPRTQAVACQFDRSDHLYSDTPHF